MSTIGLGVWSDYNVVMTPVAESIPSRYVVPVQYGVGIWPFGKTPEPIIIPARPKATNKVRYPLCASAIFMVNSDDSPLGGRLFDSPSAVGDVRYNGQGG
jgi:hypothetical protein